MAGTLDISEELCWMPAGWVYDEVLTLMATALMENHPSLSKLLLASTTEQNGGYLDLTLCDADQFQAIVRAAEDVYKEVLKEDLTTWNDPSFYPGFVKQIQNLLDMLHTRLRNYEQSR